MVPLTLSAVLHSRYTPLLLAFAVSAMVLKLKLARRTRASVLPHKEERVLVIGATSGIGRSIAQRYAKRGAKVCAVGRRENLLAEVKAECCLLRNPGVQKADGVSINVVQPTDAIIAVKADFASVEDMVKLREIVKTAWGGVDTVVVCAGVSSLRPLLEVADVSRAGQEPTVEGIQRTVDVSNAAVRGNFSGPLLSAVTLLPLLEASSSSPAMVLMSSAAGIIPAPTRSLYCSTKAASLMLYQALTIEHPKVKFTLVLPGTVEGDFRASAVDGGTVREADPDKAGLKKDYVARRTINAVDAGQRNLFLPWHFGRCGHIIYWTWTSLAEKIASRKYRFVPM